MSSAKALRGRLCARTKSDTPHSSSKCGRGNLGNHAMGSTEVRIVRKGFQAHHKQSRHALNMILDLTRLDSKSRKKTSTCRYRVPPDGSNQGKTMTDAFSIIQKHLLHPTHGNKNLKLTLGSGHYRTGTKTDGQTGRVLQSCVCRGLLIMCLEPLTVSPSPCKTHGAVPEVAPVNLG